MDETRGTHLIAALRRVPSAYWILAAVLTMCLYTLGDVTPVRYEAFGNGYEELVLFERLGNLGIVLTAAAPVVALRAPVAGVLCAAALPVLLAVVAGNHTWPLTAFVGLVAVAVCAQWASPRRGTVIGLTAMALPCSLQLGGWMLVPGGALIDLTTGPFTDNLVVFAFYLVAVLLALGAGLVFRGRVERGLAGRAALARSGEVETQAAVVGERARLARDLHDVVAHHVSLIAVRAETAPYVHPDLAPESRSVLAEIAADARLALEELRGVLGILGRADDDASRAPQPTWEDIDALLERSRSGGAAVISSDVRDTVAVNPSVGYAAYRVVQEALTNARKHAPGRPVTVTRSAGSGLVVVRVSTPLRGELIESVPGHGLAGMRERVESLGGRLSAGPFGDEFVVEATLPQGAG